MSRISFCLTTLVAAVPAAFLAYLLVTTFLFHLDALPPVLMVVLGLTLLAAAAVALTPVMAFLGGRSRAALVPAGRAAGKKSGSAAVIDDPEALDDEALSAEEFEAGDFDQTDIGEADASVSDDDLLAADAASSGEDLFEVGSGDDFDAFEDFDESPKKK